MLILSPLEWEDYWNTQTSIIRRVIIRAVISWVFVVITGLVVWVGTVAILGVWVSISISISMTVSISTVVICSVCRNGKAAQH